MTKALKCKNPNAFRCMWIVNCRQVNGTHANCCMNRWDIFPWFMTNKKCNGEKATSTHHMSIDNTKRIFQTNEHSKKKLWSTTTQKHLTATLWRFFSWTKKSNNIASRFIWCLNEKSNGHQDSFDTSMKKSWMMLKNQQATQDHDFLSTACWMHQMHWKNWGDVVCFDLCTVACQCIHETTVRQHILPETKHIDFFPIALFARHPPQFPPLR